MLGWLKGLLREAAPVADAAPAPAGRFVEAARDDDFGWRPLTQTKRDLAPMTQRRMQDLAHHAWEQHRIANRLIELPVAFILGDGVEVMCDDEEANGWLKEWQRDPITRLDLNIEKRMRELALFGEQLIPTFTDIRGHVRHGAIDPSLIVDVITDPENGALAIGVSVRADVATIKTYRVILDGEDAELLGPKAIALRERMSAGDAHFWKVNDLLTGKRGRSDLLSAIDIADAYSQMIFGEVERAIAMRTAVWDVTMTGATPEQVEERARTIAPPTPLSVRVHNEGEKWESIVPDLKASDAAETLRVVRNEALGGGTIPEHWFGGGGDVNRATAAEMDEPTYKVFRRRQLLWAAILEAEARYVIRQRLKAIGRSALLDDETFEPQAVFPAMQSIDLSRYAQALAQIIVGVASAVSAGLMREETAIALIAALADKFGVEIDPEEELKAARAAREKREELDVFRTPPAAGDPDDDDAPAGPDPAPAAAGA